MDGRTSGRTNGRKPARLSGPARAVATKKKQNKTKKNKKKKKKKTKNNNTRPASVAQLDARLTDDQEVVGSTPES